MNLQEFPRLGAKALGAAMLLPIASMLCVVNPAPAMADDFSNLDKANALAAKLAGKYVPKGIDEISKDGDTYTATVKMVERVRDWKKYGNAYSYYDVVENEWDRFPADKTLNVFRYRMKGESGWTEVPIDKKTLCTKKVKVKKGKTIEFQLRYVFYVVQFNYNETPHSYAAKYKGDWSKIYSWKNSDKDSRYFNIMFWGVSSNGDYLPKVATDNGKGDKQNLADAKAKAQTLASYAPRPTLKFDREDKYLSVSAYQDTAFLKKLKPEWDIQYFGDKYYVYVDDACPLRYRTASNGKWTVYDGQDDTGKWDSFPSKDVKFASGKTLECQLRNKIYVCKQVGKYENDFWYDPDSVSSKERDKVVAVYYSDWSKTVSYKNSQKGAIGFGGAWWVL